ncbi:MAG: hypothetical protein IJD81_11965 [Oscillospiraceae bacterium]|nr:hypothetical protein [Oscillospiraceae bacterium]
MKRFSILLLSVCLMFSTGCSKATGLFSNYRAIENLKLVHTIGFDIHKDGLQLSVSGGESENEGIIRLSASGKNISDALSAIQNYSGKEELYYAHTRYVLVGQKYAEEGLGDIMQYLESSNQLRSDLPLFLIRSGKAGDLIAHAGGKKESTFEVLEAVVRDCTQSGNSYPFTCGDIASYTAEYGSTLACALDIKPTKTVKADAEEEELTPVVAGYGIIKQGKLVHFLSEEASRGANLLLNELGTQSVTVTLNHHPYSLKLKNVETTLKPTFGESGTMTSLTVELEVEAVIEEHEQAVEIDTAQLSRFFSKAVRQWIDEVLQAMRHTQADFLGLGPRIAISYPKEWEANPLSWETQLKSLPMTAEIHCSISRGDNEAKN